MRLLSIAAAILVLSSYSFPARAGEENLDYLKGVTSIVVDETLSNTCTVMGLSEELQPSAILPAVQKMMAQTPGISVVSAQNVAKDDVNALVLHFTFSSFSETVGGETKGAGAVTMQMTKQTGAETDGLPLALSIPFLLPDTCSDIQARLTEAAVQLTQYLPGYVAQARGNK